jgi:hypothetical protein
MGPVSGGDYIDMSVFDDWANFDQPDIVNGINDQPRFSSITGGYKQVGKNVYVRMSGTFNPSAFDTSITEPTPFTLFRNMPEPAYFTPVLTGALVIKTAMGGMMMRQNPGYPGFFQVTLKPSEITNSSRIYIQGVYRTV